MNITSVKIRKMFDGEPLKAIASITLENSFAVHDVKIIHAKGKLFAVMPSKKNADGSYRDIVHPTNAQFRRELEEQLIKAYTEEKEKQALNIGAL